MEIPFIGGGYKGRSSDLNAQVCKNLYPVMDQVGGKNVAALFGTPGLTEFCDTGNAAEVRNVHVVGSNLYAVVGNTLYEINSAGTATTITGTLTTSSGFVWMADNGVELMIVDPGVDGYIYETVAGGNLTAIADGDFPTPETCVFLDGYFIVTESDTGKFWISTAYDGTAWDALDYATAERSPDNLISQIVHSGQLVLLGNQSIEAWFNTGAADFPFESMGIAATEGIGAAASIARDEESIYFLNNRGIVVKTVGYQLQRISTDSIDYIISTYSDISDARGFVYTQEGHRHLVLSFPTTGSTQATLVYDITTGFWSTRESWLVQPLPPTFYGQWRANCYAQFGTDRIVGDYENGKLYKLDMDVYTDDGNAIERTRAAQTIHEDRRNIFHHSFEVDFESGVGLVTGDELLITYDGTDYTNEVDAGAADSETMTGGDWGITRASIAGTTGTLDPEGNGDASKLITDATAADDHHIVYNDVDMVAGQTQCFSVYAKAAELEWIRLDILKDGGGDKFYQYFDLGNGVLGSNGSTPAGAFTDSTIESVGNGWYRCTIWGTISHTEAWPIVYLAEDNGDITIDGDSASGVYLWQASYTQNSIVTNSYEVQQDRPGYDPQAMMDYSDDGGHTWLNERWVSIGKIGEYLARAKWNRLGRSRNRVYRVTVSDPVKVIMINAHLNATAGLT